MTPDLWGIPGTGKVPDPGKEIRKLVDKAKREAQAAIEDVTSEAKQGIKQVENNARRGLREFEHEVKDGVEKAGEEATDAIKDAAAGLGKEALGVILAKVLDLAEHAVKGKTSVVPVIPCTPVSPGLAVELDLQDSLALIRKYANNPPGTKAQAAAMLRELAGEQYILVLLPAGNGHITVSVDVIDQELDKLF